MHGTTLITNALIEREGAVTGLVTTKGFRDVLEMRKEMRYDIYDLLITLPDPLVPRPLRLEVDERVTAAGTSSARSTSTSSRRSLRGVPGRGRRGGRRLPSSTPTATPSTSEAAGDWLREQLPDVRRLALVGGRAGDPRVRADVDHGHQRLRATARGAYLRSLGDQLRDEGFGRNLYLMLSSGGITTLETAARFPMRLVESGPAAGVLAAVFYGRARRGAGTSVASTWAAPPPRCA